MNIGTIKGAGGSHKVRAIRTLIREQDLSFITLQETQMKAMKEQAITRLWEGSSVDYAKVDANERSGGILALWNTSMFQKEIIIKRHNYLVVTGNIIGSNVELVIGVQSPYGKVREKQQLAAR